MNVIILSFTDFTNIFCVQWIKWIFIVLYLVSRLKRRRREVDGKVASRQTQLADSPIADYVAQWTNANQLKRIEEKASKVVNSVVEG